MAEPTTVPIAEGPEPEPRKRKRRDEPAGPQFVALSELAHSRVTARDLLPLVPAAIISLVFNTVFVIALVWTNAGQANATSAKRQVVNPEEESTKVEADKNKEFIDFDQPNLGDEAAVEVKIPGPEIQPDMPAGLVEPPTPTAPQGIGSGKEGGVQGAEAAGAEGISGPLIEGGKLGSLFAPDGAGPVGTGAGLPIGQGGGLMQGGGFGSRNGDLLKIAKSQGGNDASESAVARGLQWLANHQAPDGKWQLHNYHKAHPNCNCRDPIFEEGVVNSDTAGTALGLLPFLGAGHTHKKQTRYKDVVFRALNQLISKQDSKGDLGGGTLYAHALGTIALCEAYAMTSDPKLRAPAQRAVTFLVNAQNLTTGGWRYTPRSNGDTSVTGWVVMALRSGQMAGLDVPANSLDLARRWLDACAVDGGAKYGYLPNSGAKPAMTAAGLLSRQYLGWGPRNPALYKGCKSMIDGIKDAGPPAKPVENEKLGNIYYFYYASQVFHHMEGEMWETWNPLVRDHLIRTQELRGHKAGSWDPNSSDPEGKVWGGAGGRIYSTSLAILTLEVYYRHLPLYRRADAERQAPAPEKKEEMKKEEMKKDEPKKDEPKKEEPKKDGAK